MSIFQAPVPVEWNNERVLTTAQLAEYFECTPDRIYANFRNNRERFVEGVHFAKLAGENLTEFKKHVDSVYDQVADSELLELNSPQDRLNNLKKIQVVNKGARGLYVWTERGCARHAKILNTKVAWEVHEKLEDLYFRVKDAIVAAKSAPVSALLSENFEMQTQINELKSTVATLVDLINTAQANAAPDNSATQAQIDELRKSISEYKALVEVFINLLEKKRTEIKRSLTYFERADKLLTIAGMMKDSPERHAILIKAANLFVGKKFV